MAEADSFAEGLGDASPEGFAVSDATMHQDLAAVSASVLAASCTMAPGKKSQDVPDRCQPTLLSVPQELRDKIFGYVYDTSETFGNWIDLVRVSSPDGEDTAYTPGQHLPSKDPLLICRQIYAEMKKMQAAHFRDYWQKNVFVVDAMNHRHSSASSSQSHGRLAPSDLIANENLKHIHCFAFRMNAYWESYVVCFAFHEAWNVCLLLPKEEAPPRELLRYIFPQGSESANLKLTLTELNARVGDGAIRNPSRGRGFTSFRLFEFMNLLKHRLVWF